MAGIVHFTKRQLNNTAYGAFPNGNNTNSSNAINESSIEPIRISSKDAKYFENIDPSNEKAVATNNHAMPKAFVKEDRPFVPLNGTDSTMDEGKESGFIIIPVFAFGLLLVFAIAVLHNKFKSKPARKRNDNAPIRHSKTEYAYRGYSQGEEFVSEEYEEMAEQDEFQYTKIAGA